MVVSTVVQLLLAHRTPRGERRVFRDVLLVLPEIGLLLREIAERLVERGLVRPIIDLEEQLARRHVRAVGVVLLEQIPLHPGHDLSVHEAHGRSHRLGVDRDVLLEDLGHEDLGRRRSRRRASLAGRAHEDRGQGKRRRERKSRSPMLHRGSHTVRRSPQPSAEVERRFLHGLPFDV